jgi:hypothetical protein
MRARLIRWARRRSQELRAFGLLVALAVILDLIVQSNEWIEVHTPWIAHDLGHGVHLVHVVEALLTLAAFGVIASFYFSKRKPPPGPLGLLHFLLIPAAPDPRRFKFRIAHAEANLEPFVRFSDAEADIANRHPDLYGKERWDLYGEWFRIRPQSFLLLDRYDHPSGAWEPIAVSIVLPLTSDGHDELSNGSIKVTELRDRHIAREGTSSTAFLIDTWIVKPRGRAHQVDKPLRELHQKYARALLFVHLGIFWDTTVRAVFLVEADNPHIRDICADLGFDGSRRTKDHEILQRLCYPDDLRDDEMKQRLKVIVDNVAKTRLWHIAGYRP